MRYDKHTFENETISLDGNDYFSCTFKNCKLTFSGTAPVQISPLNAEDLHVEFLGAAKAGAEFQLALLTASIAGAEPGAVLQIGGRWWKETDKPEGMP
jgi:hypothetical protein